MVWFRYQNRNTAVDIHTRVSCRYRRYSKTHRGASEMMDEKDSERQESIDQRRAAEADAAFDRLLNDLHDGTSMPTEELLKLCKEKAKKRGA